MSNKPYDPFAPDMELITKIAMDLQRAYPHIGIIQLGNLVHDALLVLSETHNIISKEE